MTAFTTPPSRRGQRGLTLIEFLVSITLGMIMVAALATLIADQSTNRAEIERSGRLIENGRYAVRSMADDLQMGGYWGEVGAVTAFAGVAVPDPCLLTAAGVEAAMGLHVQGYDYPSASTTPGYNATGTAPALSCLSNIKPGTDILVARRADPDSTSLETTPAVPDMAKVAAAAGTILIQTGLDSITQTFTYSLKTANASASTNALSYPLVRKNLTTLATIRKVVVRIYYISNCSVEVSGSCSGADNGSPIPTLKMVELTTTGGAAAWNKVSLAEGVENMQVEYGVDSDNDGAPNGADVAASSVASTDWSNVASAKIYLLVRGDPTPGYTDAKTYVLGTAGTVAAPADAFKRHVFLQSVRFVNPSARRSS